MEIKEIYSLFCKHPIICTDSRKIEKGCLFFSLKGENFNGNKFAHKALEQGAAYAIIDEKKYQKKHTILVEDVLKILQNLANYHRKRLNIPILGITGTNGKTTTKELVAAVLAKKFNVAFTYGNLNNHIGVPLTLLGMNTKTEFGIVEMGANHPGEIQDLCKIAAPNFGIITNIGQAHLEGFGSLEGVIKTKNELYDYLKSDGVIFYNADNTILKELIRTVEKKISYGSSEASFTGEAINSPPFIHVKVNFKKGVLYLNSNLIGDFNFENILAAACIGNYFGIEPLEIQKAIKNYHPNNNRSQLIEKGQLKIIMDAYNANPTSMQSSIESFLNNLPNNQHLILGDMLELGTYSNNEHANIIKIIQDKAIENAFLVGKEFCKAAKDSIIKTFKNVDELCSYLKKNPIKKGNILIKGSRGIQLEKILEVLN